MVMAIQSSDDATIIFPMNEAQARNITREIKGHLREARNQVLEFYRAKAWLVMGYANFKEWAIGEFEVSWQQVYNILNAAEVDENLTTLSPQGESYFIPVKHATQLGKLRKPEDQYRAYSLAIQQAAAQGQETPTERIVEQAVIAVQSEETVFQCPYPVVRQMLAASELTAPQAKQITLELDRLNDEPSQVFVQKLMANYGLSNPDLVYPLGYRFRTERKQGGTSKMLDSLESSNGRLDGTPLSRATLRDLTRANQVAQTEHIAESEEQKRLEMLADGEAIPEQFALTLWKNAPIRSAKELIKRLPLNDLEATFELLAQYLGYEVTETNAALLDSGMVGIGVTLYQAGSFENVKEGQVLNVLARVKPEERREG